MAIFEYAVPSGELPSYIILIVMSMLTMLLFFPLRVRKKHVGLSISLALLTFAVFIFLSYCGVLAYIFPESNRLILIVIACVFLYLFLFDVSAKHVIVAGTIIYFMAQFILAITTRVVYFTEWLTALKVVVIVAACLYTYIFTWFFVIRSFRKNIYINEVLSVFVCITAVIRVLISVVLYNILLSTGISSTAYGLVSFLAWLFLNILLIGSEYHRRNATYTQQMQKVIDGEKEKQYQIFITNIDAINVKCHDLKRYTQEIKSQKVLSGGEEYFNEIEDALKIYDSVADTGNSDLDLVMSEKKLLCDRNSIALDYVVNAADLKFMTGFDVYMFFGNALENAIEACCREEEDRRIISVNIGKRSNFIFVCIENYCSSGPDFKGERLVTQKEDERNHGYGTLSIKNIAKKYGGNVEFNYANNYFTMNAFFPLG